MDVAGGNEKIQTEIIQTEMSGFTEFDSELPTARTVLWISVFVFPAGVMKDCKEADNFLICIVKISKIKAITADVHPVRWAVNRMLSESELFRDELPERLFVRE
jgi:hypothetical protein